MYYCYFENEDNMHTHYYNKFDGNNLKFALLSQYQYDCMIASETYTDGLTSLLKETVLYGDELVDAVPRVSEEDSTTSILSFNRDEILRLEDGVYYLVAYYEKDGYNYAIRISDKAIQVSKDGSNIGQFKLVDII